MDRNDQQAIAGLFEKLAAVEQSLPERDREAEGFIHERIARQPGSPYYMAQTIVMQEAALTAAQARIEDLEAESAAAASSRGGLFSGIFGAPAQPQRSAHAMPQVARRERADPQQAPVGSSGGGFLAGAAQTAMGVAGGVLLGNAIAGMFGGAAEAGDLPQEELEETAAGPGDAGELDDLDF